MSDLSKIGEGARICASRGQVSTDLDGEAVILNLEQGVYYGLNPVGARVWSLIQEPRTFDQLIEVLLAEYEVDLQVCRQEVLGLLAELASHGLIEVKDALRD